MSYYTKLTDSGLNAITAALNSSSKVPISYMAFGDGLGSVPEPDEHATSLVNEVYRVGINKVEVHEKNENWLVCEAVIPSAVGGFNIREIALYDNTGNTMLAIANYPPTYKPSVEEGAAKIQTIRIVIQVDNSGVFELIIDPDIVLATTRSVMQAKEDAIAHSDHLFEELDKNLPTTFGQPAGLMGGAVRLKPDGTPYFIADNAHAPIGFTGVEKSGNYILRVNYEHQFKKVGTLLATVDETLAPYMLSIGGSVAQNFANLQIAAPLYFTAKGDGTITQIPEIWKDYVQYSAATSSPSQGYVVFSTPAKPITAQQPVVSALTDPNWISRHKNYSSYSSDSALRVAAFAEVENMMQVKYQNGVFDIAGYRKSGYSVEFANGVLTINHPTQFSTPVPLRIIEPMGANYSYILQGYTTTSTTYKVFDETGALKLTPDNIIFNFKIETYEKHRALEPLTESDSFTVFAGYYYLPVDALKKMQAGNLWMTGIMNR
ncbi:phage tail protein [Acinetobacter sp. BWR-L5]|uniref:phage tail protein n=1 Tax=Acinetobacter sp. BWR-L5 TaxID=2815725 RepID=UPI0031FE6623